MSSSSSQLPKAKKTKKDRKKLKKAQDEANAVYDSLSNGQTDILSKFSTEQILGMRLSNYDRNLLHIAVWFNVEALIEKLCSNSAFKSMINDKDANGETPLHISVFCQNIEAYRKLLAAGANLEITNNKGESPLDTAVDPAKWQNYQNKDQAEGISPSIIKSDQVEKSEEMKNTEPKPQAQQSPQEQPQKPIVVQQSEIKKNEDKNKQPIENKSVEKNTLEVQPMDSKEMPPSPNFGAVNKDVAKNIQPEIRTPIPNKTQEQKNENKITPFVEKEVQKIDEVKVSTEIKKSFSDNKEVKPFVDKEVRKVDENKNSTEIKKPSTENKVTPFAEKEIQKIDEKKNSIEIKKPLSDNKVTPIPQEKDIPVPKKDDKISTSQEKKKSQDFKVTPILPEKDDSRDIKNTRISQEKEKQDLKIPSQNDFKKDYVHTFVEPQPKDKQDLKMPPQKDPLNIPVVPQEKKISTIPTHNQNKEKDTTKVPEKTIIKDTSNPLNLVINPKTHGDTVPQPRKNTSQKDLITPQENPKKIESNQTPTLPQKNLNDSTPYSLVNHGTTSRETQPKKIDTIVKKAENNNNDSDLIETFGKPQTPTIIPSKNETPSPTKRNTSRSRTNLNLNESKSNISPKLVEKKKNEDSKKDLRESHIPDILDKTDKTKMPVLNLQPTPIKPQQKRENSKETIRAPVTDSSSRLNESSLPSLQKGTRAGSRGGSKTPFRTNAREIIGSNNPASLTFETKSPTKVESKRDISRNKDSNKSILASHLNLIDDKSPGKRENSSLMNKRPNMMSYKGSGANLQLDISRKLKDDYPNPKADKGYKVGSKIDSLDSTSSPSLGFNDRRLSNIMNVHSKYINDTSSLKILEQRNRPVEKVNSNEVIFEYSNHSQANIRTKTEQNKEWDSMFDISMHTEGNDKSFGSPFRPGRMLYVNPVDNTYPKIKPINPEKKDRTLSPIRDKDPEYSFGRPLVPKQDLIFGRQKSPTGKREETSPSPLRKAELIYVTNSDYNFTTQGSDAPLNDNRRFKRDTWKGGNFG